MMAKTMKALVKAKKGPGLEMQEQPVPEIADDEVLIRVHKTAICGTDMHIWNWDEWAEKTIPVPMVVGHEYGGHVVAVGKDVTRISEGDRVTGEGHIVGRTSRAARAGRFHLDPDTRGVGVDRPGAFAEYVRIPAFNAIRLPDYVTDEIAAILDPLGNAVHTALSFDLVAEDVLITGAGPIGIMAAAVARHAGARYVVITDINEYRLDLARKVANVRPVNVKDEDLRDVMKELGMSEGFDIGFEMSGVPQAFDQMIDHMIMGGKIALLGIPSGKPQIDLSKIIFKALEIRAIYGREMFETWYKMLAMLGSGLDVSDIITHRFGATNFKKGFEVMGSGNSGKVVLDWKKIGG